LIMEVEHVIEKNINLAISFIDVADVEINFDSVRDETFKDNVRKLFQELKDEPQSDSRAETFDEVNRDQ
jgi:formiminotetrahydrofolate cyclodeaminase